MTIRPLDWARDGAGILKLDTTYETDRIYAVKSGPLGIWLVEQVLGQPVLNHYDPSGFEQDCARADHALVFESASGDIGGFAAVRLEAWNRSALLSAIFVAPAFRGTGIGRVLLGRSIACCKVRRRAACAPKHRTPTTRPSAFTARWDSRCAGWTGTYTTPTPPARRRR
ncbi:GNAT family N-acetyltransferase [Cupriavidus sp. D39]|uniref:GNAT family N-acetyltransferase n=1 Tax=Cupriavidus sp. D39 TaxID=2997877 RepID=UPI00226F0B51|nr:GNAT family N-acetyltransferase [Cupriavidus sp. D39]MCY0856053.1 GNAT family N-acetyltransferase [Cupriavidus sp. D39]